jgi:hypothetical protein
VSASANAACDFLHSSLLLMTIDLDDPIAVLLAVEQAMRAAGHRVAAYGGLVLAVGGPGSDH